MVRQSMDTFPCRSLRRSRRASRQSSATLSVSASGLMVARSWRLGHSGSRLPGSRYESSRHGLALHAREPPVPAQCGPFTATKASSRLGTRHIVQMQRGGPVAPLPVRHPGPRVTAAGCCTPAPSGPATTAAQSGQRHASYHPPRPIMSAARDKMLSTPCRARLRAARHYRIAPPGDRPREAPWAASGRRNGSDGHAPQTARPNRDGKLVSHDCYSWLPDPVDKPPSADGPWYRLRRPTSRPHCGPLAHSPAAPTTRLIDFRVPDLAVRVGGARASPVAAC